MKSVLRAASALLFACCIVFPAIEAHAQVTATAPIIVSPRYNNRWEVYGGGQYSHFNPSPGRNIHATNLEGWNGSAVVYLRPSWGFEASVRGLYGKMSVPTNIYNIPPNPSMSETLFLFGPTFRLLRGRRYAAGFHTLIGAAYGSFDKDFPPGVQPINVNIYDTKLAFGAAIGWFTDFNLSNKWAIRAIGDFQPTHYGYTEQNEFAGSVGIVYKFGKLRK